MEKFKDRNGEEWSIDISVEDLRMVRDQLGLNLLEIIEGPLLEEFARDPVRLIDVLAVLCREQMAHRGIDAAAFGRRFSGDALEAAAEAFAGAIVAFFPRSRRELFRRAIEKGREINQAQLAIARRRIEEAKPQEMAEVLLSKPGAKSADAPGSSESTPGHGTSAS